MPFGQDHPCHGAPVAVGGDCSHLHASSKSANNSADSDSSRVQSVGLSGHLSSVLQALCNEAKLHPNGGDGRHTARDPPTTTPTSLEGSVGKPVPGAPPGRPAFRHHPHPSHRDAGPCGPLALHSRQADEWHPDGAAPVGLPTRPPGAERQGAILGSTAAQGDPVDASYGMTNSSTANSRYTSGFEPSLGEWAPHHQAVGHGRPRRSLDEGVTRIGGGYNSGNSSCSSGSLQSLPRPAQNLNLDISGPVVSPDGAGCTRLAGSSSYQQNSLPNEKGDLVSAPPIFRQLSSAGISLPDIHHNTAMPSTPSLTDYAPLLSGQNPEQLLYDGRTGGGDSSQNESVRLGAVGDASGCNPSPIVESLSISGSDEPIPSAPVSVQILVCGSSSVGWLHQLINPANMFGPPVAPDSHCSDDHFGESHPIELRRISTSDASPNITPQLAASAAIPPIPGKIWLGDFKRKGNRRIGGVGGTFTGDKSSERVGPYSRGSGGENISSQSSGQPQASPGPQVIMNWQTTRDKPWRHRAHNLSPWFNYGFTENTFKSWLQHQIDRRRHSRL